LVHPRWQIFPPRKTRRARGAAFGGGERRKISERYAEGATMVELAAEYEVGEATIWRALQPAA
jgi:hypothetical protein